MTSPRRRKSINQQLLQQQQQQLLQQQHSSGVKMTRMRMSVTVCTMYLLCMVPTAHAFSTMLRKTIVPRIPTTMTTRARFAPRQQSQQPYHSTMCEQSSTSTTALSAYAGNGNANDTIKVVASSPSKSSPSKSSSSLLSLASLQLKNVTDDATKTDDDDDDDDDIPIIPAPLASTAVAVVAFPNPELLQSNDHNDDDDDDVMKDNNDIELKGKTQEATTSKTSSTKIQRQEKQKQKQEERLQKEEQAGIPSYRTMLLFVSTTILIWLSEPLLSLVDTTVVGRFASMGISTAGAGTASPGVMQLAALGPATMLMDSALYLTYFLSIATTNTIANALARREYRKLQTSSSQVMGLATAMGAMLTFVVYTAGRPLLHWAAGGSSSPPLISLALDYCRIRSSVAPFCIMGMVAQSICLASLDTVTPAVAVVVASVVNVVGDLWLVPQFGMQGAAVATAAASVASSLVLLWSVKQKMMTWRRKENNEDDEIDLLSLSTVTATTTPLQEVPSSLSPTLPTDNNQNTDTTAAANNNAMFMTTSSSPESKSTESAFISKVVNGIPILGYVENEESNNNNNVKNNIVKIRNKIDTEAVDDTKQRLPDMTPTPPPTRPAKQGLKDTFTSNKSSKSSSSSSALIPLFSFPDPNSLWKLFKMAGPIFFCIVGKVVCYSAMTIRAADFGVTALAAHNVMMRVFFFFSTFGDSVSQASQTFVPRAAAAAAAKTAAAVVTTATSKDQTQALQTKDEQPFLVQRKLVQRLAIVAAGIGLMNKISSQFVLKYMGRYFTQDGSILQLMASHSTYAGWALLLHPFIMLFEGCILARQDLMFLLGSYVVTMACHFTSLSFGAKTFGGVWKALFFFQTFRLVQFSWRVWNTMLLNKSTRGEGTKNNEKLLLQK